jgi:riboflavin synthase
MFTGLIESVGTVLSVRPTGGATRLLIAAPELAGRWKIGDSIAVNGVCLTAVDMHEEDDPTPGRFCADLAGETIERTTLAELQPGALVNLELPTPSGSPLGGPLHSDLERTDWRMTVEAPSWLRAGIVAQGSITIDGISLTVAKVEGNRIEIAVIPHTYKATNLHSLMAGSAVNIETDVLSKYAARRVEAGEAEALAYEAPAATVVAAEAQPAGEWLTNEYLIANGY